MKHDITCCNSHPKWVENVAGKGYYFCDVCRKEVNTEAISDQEFDRLNSDFDNAWSRRTKLPLPISYDPNDDYDDPADSFTLDISTTLTDNLSRYWFKYPPLNDDTAIKLVDAWTGKYYPVPIFDD